MKLLHKKFRKFLDKERILSFVSLNSRTIIALSAAFLLSASVAFATPPTTPYNQNETLDPSCGPTDTNCYVVTNAAPISGSANYIQNGTSPQTANFNLSGSGVLGTSLTSPILYGGTTSGGTLTLSSTSHATKGKILFGTSGYDEANNRLGIGTASPSSLLTFQSSSSNESAPVGTELTSSGSWTSTGWTGSQGAGFSHTIGNTNNLSQTLSISASNYYLVTFTVSGFSTGNVNVSLGGTTSVNGGGDLPSTSNNTFSWAVYTTTTAGLNFIPTTDFNGTLSNISVKQVTGTYGAIMNINGSNGSSDFEIRSAPTLNTAAYSGPDVFVGQNAGSQNVTGGMDTAIGTGAMQGNISGSEDVAIGYLSQNSAVSGWYNVSVGHLTLQHLINGYDNTAVGDDSMYQATSAHSNACFGNGTCLNLTTGVGNTALGDHTLDGLTTGQGNIAIGWTAMQTGSTGNDNIAIGASSLEASTGSYAIAIGTYAGNALTSAGSIVAIGNNALLTDTTGGFDTAVGAGVMQFATGGSDTAFGSFALSVVTGSLDTAIGLNALASDTTGASNTGVGNNVGYHLIGGSNNVAMGDSALYTEVANSNNTALGYSALYSATTNNNTAVGYYAGHNISTGADSTAIGGQALLNTAGGWYNVALGYNAGDVNVNGQYNTYLGYASDANANNYSNSTALGTGAIITASHQIMLGTSAENVVIPGSTLTIGGQIGALTLAAGTANSLCYSTTALSGFNTLSTCSSDERLKQNITPLDDTTLAGIMKLNPVSFTWNPTFATDQTVQFGLIAQDVAQVFPNLVSKTAPTALTPDGTYSINFNGLYSPIIKSIQEMNLNVTNISDLTKTNTWRDSLIAWLGDAENGITSLFVHEVTTDTLCVGTQDNRTCITKDQLDSLLQHANQNNVSSVSPQNTDTVAPTDTVPPETTTDIPVDAPTTPSQTPTPSSDTVTDQTTTIAAPVDASVESAATN